MPGPSGQRGVNMERVKFNSQAYDLATNGLQLTEQGGKIIMLMGSHTFDAAKADIQTMKSITALDSAGEPFLTRSDLVYAGRLTVDDNYVIGAENVQIGTDEATGEPIYSTQDVTGSVLIAEFRMPDLREKLAEMEAKLEYVAMMSNVELEV